MGERMGLPGMGAGGALGFLSGGNTPQDWGQGIQNAPFSPYFTGPGTVAGPDPYVGQRGMPSGPWTQLPQPMDQWSPGVAEQWQQQNQGFFMQPGASQDYYNDFRSRMPSMANDPGLDPYYERARGRLGEDINQQLASRGMYGSSTGMDMLSEGLGGLNAEQANREADYNLRRMAEQRGWEGLGGSLAGQADQGELQRRLGGFGAASQAQEFARQRARDYMGDVMGTSGMMSGMAGDTYNDMLSSDAQLMQNAMMMETGLAQAALQASLYNQQRQKDDASWAKGMLGGGLGKGGK